MNAYTSSVAVMARRVEPADSLDFFPTPPWSTRALTRHVLPLAFPWPDLYAGTAWDPACGQGHMALALAETFRRVEASDIFDYGFGKVADFLHPDFAWRPADWIITNPPFNLGAEFVMKALELARVGVAMLVRMQFLEGGDRYRALYGRPRFRPHLVGQFVERVPMHKGRWVINGSTATAYAWLVWLKHPPHDAPTYPPFVWIEPGQRKALSQPDDWLNFGGCMDLPKTHPAIRLQEDLSASRPGSPPAGGWPPAGRPTTADGRAAYEDRVEASLADIARELQGRLI